jgi:predicted amidophosphoribosyltransferase
MISYCINCGKEIEESWNACPNCGKNLKEGTISQSQPQLNENINVETKLICGNCNQEVNPNQVICLNCGVQLKKIKSTSFVNKIAKGYCYCIIGLGIVSLIMSLFFVFF